MDRCIKLDDWVNGKPDAWDYEAVLREHDVLVIWAVEWDDDVDSSFSGWSFSWKHGTMFIGKASEVHAKKAAALFVSLWLLGVSASFADKLMNGYIMYLELQENASSKA